MLRQLRGWPGPGAFFRRDVLRLVGLRDPAFPLTADAKFWLMVGLSGRMARLPLTLAAFRAHGGSTSVRRAEALTHEMIRLADHVFEQPWLPASYAPLAREARSHVLAMAGAVAHRRSHRSALAYYTRSLATHPLAWGRLPARMLLGRVARSLLPFPLLAPAFKCRDRRLTAHARRHIVESPFR
jgi:hypothetical protein